MIKSWKEFFVEVEQMRECQKNCFRNPSPSARSLAKRCERAVDRTIAEKRAEWSRQTQPELGI
ncbi:MAG: hypothetical protein LBB83_03965 [Treponema sp.]|jgi:hypothetical protein|nr:hypothetical protein [Treponema sp.]